MLQAGFEPQSQLAIGRRPTPLTERSLGSTFRVELENLSLIFSQYAVHDDYFSK